MDGRALKLFCVEDGAERDDTEVDGVLVRVGDTTVRIEETAKGQVVVQLNTRMAKASR